MVQPTPHGKIKILLLEGIHSVAAEKLRTFGFYVEEVGHSLAEEELLRRAEGFQAVGIRSKTQLPAPLLNALKQLWVVGCFCIGTNQVDLTAANRLGVPVFNAPYSNTRSVAEMVIAEMIGLARQLGDRSRMAHEGKWQKSAGGSHEVRGKTLGVVGYGHIGSQVSVLAEAMGLTVVYYDIVKKLPLGNARALDSLEALLKISDFVSFHVPATPLTRGMMNAQAFEFMKSGSYLINASRGSVVDIAALAANLRSGRLAGAAIDVFPKEPASNGEPFVSELCGIPNVILTPHVGGSTEEAQEAIGHEVADSLLQFLSAGNTAGAVNFPRLEVAPATETRRLINVHKNVPGVLGEINSIASRAGVNIQRQMLSTDSAIGYLVMDMELEDAQQVAQQIEHLATSIKTRII